MAGAFARHAGLRDPPQFAVDERCQLLESRIVALIPLEQKACQIGTCRHCPALWTALPRFRNESSERTFVFRIALNRAIRCKKFCRAWTNASGVSKRQKKL